MKGYIWRRVLDVSVYIADTGATVRDAAAEFEVSKSTVHKDISERLPQIDSDLATRVRKVMEKNKAERHLRGGEATRQKYAEQAGVS